IRDRNVTGVQTCALPISPPPNPERRPGGRAASWHCRAPGSRGIAGPSAETDAAAGAPRADIGHSDDGPFAHPRTPNSALYWRITWALMVEQERLPVHVRPSRSSALAADGAGVPAERLRVAQPA